MTKDTMQPPGSGKQNLCPSCENHDEICPEDGNSTCGNYRARTSRAPFKKPERPEENPVVGDVLDTEQPEGMLSAGLLSTILANLREPGAESRSWVNQIEAYISALKQALDGEPERMRVAVEDAKPRHAGNAKLELYNKMESRAQNGRCPLCDDEGELGHLDEVGQVVFKPCPECERMRQAVEAETKDLQGEIYCLKDELGAYQEAEKEREHPDYPEYRKLVGISDRTPEQTSRIRDLAKNMAGHDPGKPSEMKVAFLEATATLLDVDKAVEAETERCIKAMTASRLKTCREIEADLKLDPVGEEGIEMAIRAALAPEQEGGAG